MPLKRKRINAYTPYRILICQIGLRSSTPAGVVNQRRECLFLSMQLGNVTRHTERF